MRLRQGRLRGALNERHVAKKPRRALRFSLGTTGRAAVRGPHPGTGRRRVKQSRSSKEDALRPGRVRGAGE